LSSWYFAVENAAVRKSVPCKQSEIMDGNGDLGKFFFPQILSGLLWNS